MQVSTRADKIYTLALNKIERRAVELIHSGRKSEAVILLDSQLEYDPSRAETAVTLIKDLKFALYLKTFMLVAEYHEAGRQDAYQMGHLPGAVENRRNLQRFYAEEARRLGQPSPFDISEPPPYRTFSSDDSTPLEAKKNK